MNCLNVNVVRTASMRPQNFDETNLSATLDHGSGSNVPPYTRCLLLVVLSAHIQCPLPIYSHRDLKSNIS